MRLTTLRFCGALMGLMVAATAMPAMAQGTSGGASGAGAEQGGSGAPGGGTGTPGAMRSPAATRMGVHTSSTGAGHRAMRHHHRRHAM